MVFLNTESRTIISYKCTVKKGGIVGNNNVVFAPSKISLDILLVSLELDIQIQKA